MLLRIGDLAVNKFCIHFLYLSEKRLSLKACIFGSKQMAFVYLAFFDDGTALSLIHIYIVEKTSLTLEKGATAFDALSSACSSNGVSLKYQLSLIHI